jgi:hypothetical protein
MVRERFALSGNSRLALAFTESSGMHRLTSQARGCARSYTAFSRATLTWV